jgi:hypothetical protein
MLVHHFTKWLGGDPRTVIPGWEGFVVTDLAAPAFTIAAGASAVLWATRRPVSAWTVLRRYGLLVPTGMLLQWLFTSHVPFDWGVLQALGVGVTVSTLVAMVVPSSWLVGGLALFALVFGPIVESVIEGAGTTGRLADALSGVFPVVTYTGFALAGATGGLLLRRNPDRGTQALALGGVLVVATLVMLEAGMPPDRYPGGAAFVIPGMAGTLLLFGVLDRWSAMPAAFGNHTLGIFIAHYALFWVLARWGLWDSMEPETALVVAFGAVLVFAVLAPRVPKLPWSPRTGWATRRAPTNPVAA